MGLLYEATKRREQQTYFSLFIDKTFHHHNKTCIVDEQAEFRKEFATVNHTRTANQMIVKEKEYYLSLNLYFIDFRQHPT